MGFLLPALIVVVLDQLSKQIMWNSFDLGRSVDIIHGVFRITLVRNAGAAFGLFEGGRVVFIIASLIAAVFLIFFGLRISLSEKYKRLLLALILGGAVGNLIDRVYAGEVIDFLEIGVGGYWWPVFNVADMAVTIGAILLLIHLLRSPGGQKVPEPGVSDTDPNAGGSP